MCTQKQNAETTTQNLFKLIVRLKLTERKQVNPIYAKLFTNSKVLNTHIMSCKGTKINTYKFYRNIYISEFVFKGYFISCKKFLVRKTISLILFLIYLMMYQSNHLSLICVVLSLDTSHPFLISIFVYPHHSTTTLLLSVQDSEQ